jgi:amino acid transporter
MAAVATVFSGTLARLVPALQSRTAEAVVLAILFAVLAWVNVRGVKQGTRLIEITTISKLLPLALFVVVGAFFIDGSNLAIESLPTAKTLGVTTITLIFAFAGVESALVPSGEVKEPHRTVPRALAGGMVLITLLYIAIQVVAQGILGPALSDPANARAPLAAAAERFMGSGGAMFMLIGAAISTFGYVSGMTLATPRALFAFGRDGFAPSALAKVHDRFHTPHVAIVAQVVIVFLLASTGTFLKLVQLANVSVLLLYLACCIAAWELRRRDVRAGGLPFRVPGGGVVPWIASAVIVAMLASATSDELLVVGVALAAATAIFFITRNRRRTLQTARA